MCVRRIHESSHACVMLMRQPGTAMGRGDTAAQGGERDQPWYGFFPLDGKCLFFPMSPDFVAHFPANFVLDEYFIHIIDDLLDGATQYVVSLAVR